jgi:hypothetical protein
MTGFNAAPQGDMVKFEVMVEADRIVTGGWRQLQECHGAFAVAVPDLALVALTAESTVHETRQVFAVTKDGRHVRKLKIGERANSLLTTLHISWMRFMSDLLGNVALPGELASNMAEVRMMLIGEHLFFLNKLGPFIDSELYADPKEAAAKAKVGKMWFDAPTAHDGMAAELSFREAMPWIFEDHQ